jgi:hypothetical protein
VELTSQLDRDLPGGVPIWRFMVQAIDADGKGLIGYADIQVKVVPTEIEKYKRKYPFLHCPRSVT